MVLMTAPLLSYSQERLIDRLAMELTEKPDTIRYLAYYDEATKGSSQLLELIADGADSVPHVDPGHPLWFATMEDFVNHKLGGFHHGEYKPAFSQMPITFDSISIGYPMHDGFTALGIYYQAEETLHEALGIISSHKIPEQNWSFHKPHSKDIHFLKEQEENWFFEFEGLDHPLSFIFKIETPVGEFLMALAQGDGHSSFHNKGKHYHFTIFKRSSHHWEFYDRFLTDSFLLPWMDMDGDGVPELLYEAHGSIFFGVFSFYPNYHSVVPLSGER